MNRNTRNPILWLSIILNLVLTVAIIIMCSVNGKNVEKLEQKVSEYETALSSVVESYESKLYAATTTTSEPKIEETTTTADTTSAQTTTTAAPKTTAKKTTTTKSTTATQKPTTAATQSGDNDGGWIDGWY